MDSRIIVIVDDDALLGMTIAREIQATHRRVVLCQNIESAIAVIERWDVSLLLTDIRLTPPFGWEGLELVRRVRNDRPRVAVVAMSGLLQPDLQTTLLDRGALAILQKPFAIEDLEALIAASPPVMIPDELEGAAPILRFPQHDAVMSAEFMGRLFQPIIDIATETVRILGVEALSHHRQGDPLADIQVLLRYAELVGRAPELDLNLVAHCLKDAEPFSGRTLIFVNVHPFTLSRPENVLGVVRHASQRGFPVESLVIEITENVEIRDRTAALDSLARLGQLGVRFALDDVGAAFSNRWLLEQQPPAWVKISQQLGSGFERRDAVKENIVRNIHQVASELGIPTILEGIETPAALDKARQIGIPFGQGYYLGRPALSSSIAAGFLDAA